MAELKMWMLMYSEILNYKTLLSRPVMKGGSGEKSTAQLLSITELSGVYVCTIPSLWGINTQIYQVANNTLSLKLKENPSNF